MSVTRTLAEEIVRTSRASIPAAAIDLVKAMFVDHVGIAFMGHQFTGAGLIGYARELGGPEEGLHCEGGATVRIACGETEHGDEGQRAAYGGYSRAGSRTRLGNPP